MTSHRALITQRTRLSRNALAAAVDTAVDALRAAGVHPLDRVGLCGDSTAEYVTLFLALAHLDATVVVLDPRGYPTAAAATAALELDHIVLPRATHRTGRHHQDWLTARPGATVHRTADLVTLPPGDAPEPETTPRLRVGGLGALPWARRAGALVQTTSGTTGTPKIVAKTPQRMIANCLRTAEVVDYRDDDVLAPILPLDHQYGLSVLLIGLVVGLPVVIGDPARVLETLRLALRHGATVVDTTPRAHAAVLRAVESGRLSHPGLADVRLWCVGGGPSTADLRRRAAGLLGRPLLDGYGSTELGNVAHVDPDNAVDLRPLPGVELRITQEDGGDAAGWGRLHVRTPDAPLPGHGWHDTGDLARLDPAGRLIVAGRYDAVIRNGIVIHPASIEHRLADAGIQAMAVAVDGRDPGSEPKVVVVVEDPFRRRPGFWRDRVDELGPALERPDRVLTLPAFPRTPGTGKTDRRRLTRWVAAVEHREDRAVTGLGRAADESAGPAPLPGRTEALARTRRWIAEHPERLIELLAPWSSVPAARLEIAATLAALDGAAADLELHAPPRVPHSWVYLPSNVVLYSYALYLLVPSLWTEELWFRPSSRVAEASAALHRELAPVHGLDLHLFTGSQADYATLRSGLPGTIVFTGKYDNAEQVRATLTDGQVMTFFGQGSNPIIVGPDADLELTVRDCVSMRLLNSGQDCFAPDVYFVHADVADRLVAGLVDHLRDIDSTPRHTREPAVLRPAAAEDLARIAHHVGSHPERVVHGGRIDLPRRLIHPTVLRWDLAEAPLLDEMFAPVFNVVVWDDEDALRATLDQAHYRDRTMCVSLYGAGAGLADWCAQRATVCLDATIVATDDPGLPFGGIGERANYTATRTAVEVGPVLLSATAAGHRQELATLPTEHPRTERTAS